MAIFDEARDSRKAAGELEYRLLRSDVDANNIVHLSEWTSHAAARELFESPELVEIMGRGQCAGATNSVSR